jgi:hypothetical protein
MVLYNSVIVCVIICCDIATGGAEPAKKPEKDRRVVFESAIIRRC